MRGVGYAEIVKGLIYMMFKTLPHCFYWLFSFPLGAKRAQNASSWHLHAHKEASISAFIGIGLSDLVRFVVT